jgi:hypothetical protein
MGVARPYRGPIIALLTAMAALLLLPTSSNAKSRVRFRILNGHLIVVPTYVNGRGPFDFLVDTGTNTTLIDVGLAAELELKPLRKQSLRTFTGSEEASRYSLGPITVGAHCVPRLAALAVEMSTIHRVDPRIRGLLGLDFLLEFDFLLDYGHQQIELYDPTETPDLAAGTRIPIEIRDARILMTTRTAASVTGSWRVALDSGITNMALFEDRIGASQDSLRSRDGKILITTVLSSLATNTATVHDLTLANLRLRDVSVLVLPTNPELQRGIEDGLMPASFFRSILVNVRENYAIFDLEESKIVKSPPPL